MEQKYRDELLDFLKKELAPIASEHEAHWIVEDIETKTAHLTEAIALAQKVLLRRHQKEPLAYILGNWSFRDLVLQVGPGVLIPRPETEELVDHALQASVASVTLMKHATPSPGSEFRIADLGAGSGCLGLGYLDALLKNPAFAENRKPAIRLDFVESSYEARWWLQKNIQPIKTARTEVFFDTWTKWFELQKPASVAVILANPPYITEDEFAQLDEGVARFEPRAALVPGDPSKEKDAGGPYREILEQASKCLVPGGVCAFEMGPAQTPWIADHAKSLNAFDKIDLVRDMAGKERFLICRKS